MSNESLSHEIIRSVFGSSVESVFITPVKNGVSVGNPTEISLESDEIIGLQTDFSIVLLNDGNHSLPNIIVRSDSTGSVFLID